MKQLLALAVAASLASPLAAQDTETEEGFDLMREGSRLILRGLIEELGPAIEDMDQMSEEMRDALSNLTSEMGPALRDLVDLIDEIGHYDAPEVMENGDIIIRRKSDAPPYEAPDLQEDAPEDDPEDEDVQEPIDL